MKTLTIKIDGRSGVADFGDFAAFSNAVAEALTITHRRLYPERQKRPRYNVVSLNVGSAMATLAPATNAGNVFESFVETLTDIRVGRVPHGRISSEDVRCYQKLGSVLKSRTDYATVGDVEITEDFVVKCEQLINSAPKSLGQVVGFLQGVNTHRATCFRIYPEGQNFGAECYLKNPEVFDQMMELYDKRIRLTGLVRRNPDGSGVDRIEVDSVERMPQPGETPKLASLIGIWRDDAPFDLPAIRAEWNE